jgi:hypothetical protein
MKQHLSKLQKPEEQQTADQQLAPQSSGARQFGSVEEMLRYDSSQTSPPSTLETRLIQSIEQEPPARLPWWRRWFWK